MLSDTSRHETRKLITQAIEMAIPVREMSGPDIRRYTCLFVEHMDAVHVHYNYIIIFQH